MQQDFTKHKKELAEINNELAKAQTLKDPKKLKELSKQHSYLQEIVSIGEKIKSTEKEKKDLEKLLKEEKDKEMQKLTKTELEQLREALKSLRKEFKTLTSEKALEDSDDNRNVILEIRAGTGGEESALFAYELYRMYLKYAEQKGWKVEEADIHQSSLKGVKQVTAMFKGDDVYGELKYESGVHRVQRVPITESSGRIHTSAASVVVLPEADEVEVKIKPEDIKIDVFRAGGPGGQGVNRTDSAVRVTHLPTNTVVSSQESRSQIQNREQALTILRSKIYEQKLKEEKEREGSRRRSAIGTGDRSEKIRTYNFPQDRVTDHRIKKSWHNLPKILDGEIQEIINTLKSQQREDKTNEK